MINKIIFLTALFCVGCNDVALKSWVFVEDGIKNADGTIIHYDELQSLQDYIAFDKKEVVDYATACKKWRDSYEEDNK